jgi:hypothetical protein
MKRCSNFIEMLDRRRSDESTRVPVAIDGDGITPEERQARQPPTFMSHVTRREAWTATPHGEPQKSLNAPPALLVANDHWFSPDWTDENQFGHIAHGDFQSPVRVAISMAIAADRGRHKYSRDAIESTDTAIPGTIHAHQGGELRALLACIAASRKVSERSRSQRLTSSGCFGTLHPQFDYDGADESLLYVPAATILGLALAVYVRVRTHRLTVRAA